MSDLAPSESAAARHARGDAAPPPAGLELPATFWRQLRARYRTPPRHYHSFEHVGEVLEQYQQVAEHVGWERPREVYWAILFHDAVYDVGRSDNEIESASLALAEAARWLAPASPPPAISAPSFDSAYVRRLIELTARHGALTRDLLSDQEALFLDCDMAILGAPPERFERYERDIAREYIPLVGAPRYREGRIAFLDTLLGRAYLYLSPYFHRRLDRAARANLMRARRAL